MGLEKGEGGSSGRKSKGRDSSICADAVRYGAGHFPETRRAKVKSSQGGPAHCKWQIIADGMPCVGVSDLQ